MFCNGPALENRLSILSGTEVYLSTREGCNARDTDLLRSGTRLPPLGEQKCLASIRNFVCGIYL